MLAATLAAMFGMEAQARAEDQAQAERREFEKRVETRELALRRAVGILEPPLPPVPTVTVDSGWPGGRCIRSRKSSRLRRGSRSMRRAAKRANRRRS